MARLEEQVRKVKQELRDKPELMRAAISEIHRRDAAKAVGGMQVTSDVKTQDWRKTLLETEAGKQFVQAKETAVANKEAALRRYRELKQFVHDQFVVAPKFAEPVMGWKPMVRFDIYQNSREACWKLAQVGGKDYERAITAVKYALNSSRDYRDAIEALGQ